MTSPATWLRRFTAATTVGGLLLVGAPALDRYDAPDGDGPGLVLTSAGHKHHKHRHHKHRHHRGRKIVHYTVRPGDTATGLAVRFHAWTAELIALNHLGPDEALYVGERIRIPVVRSAVRKARHHAGRHHGKKHHAKRHHGKKHHANKHHAKRHRTRHHRHESAHHSRHHDRLPHVDRAKVRHVVVRTARRHGVPPNLALAIAWQEAGWQMHLVSSANAIGAMQVLPSTGRWVSTVVGRRLDLHDLHDNVTAGVVLIKLLRAQAKRRKAVAGYYQGLASVRRHGMYADTKRYVASVLAIRRSLRHGWSPV